MEKPAARKTQKRARRARRRKLSLVFPEVAPRKLVRIGKSHYIALPPTWFKAHRLDPAKIDELLTAADTDILILNPRSVKRFTRKISALIRPGLPRIPASPRRPAPPRKRRVKKPPGDK